MKKNINALIGTFEKVARATAGRHDIEVIASSACATDGRKIYFPANADCLDGASKNTLAGWLDHEVGHITEEDAHRLAGKQTPLEYLAAAKSHKEGALMNVYEDIRMETKKATELVGVADNLKAAQLHSIEHVAERVNAPGFDNFWYAIGCAIIEKAHGLDASWLPAQYQPYIDAVQQEISEAADLSKTRWADDTWNLAQRTLDKIAATAEEINREQEKREQEKQEQSEEGEQGEDTNEGTNEDTEDDGEQGESEGENTGDQADVNAEEDGEFSGKGDDTDEDTEDDTEDDGEGQGQAEGQSSDDSAEGSSEGSSDDTEDDGEGDDSADQGEGDIDDPNKDGGSTVDNDTGSDNPQAQGEPSVGDLTDDELKAAKEIAELAEQDADFDDLMDKTKADLSSQAEDARKTSGAYSVTPAALAADRWVTPEESKRNYDQAKNIVAKQIRGMKGKLLNLIRTQAEATMIGDQDEGDLDADALYSVRAGNRRVFTQTVKGQTIDTAISILIDQSGSMSGRKAEAARLMAVALGETFNALNIPFEVIGFHTAYDAAGYNPNGNGTARNQAMEYQVYKTFAEKYRKIQNRFGTIDGYEYNADPEAVLETAKRLIVRQEQRKIMFVISDGMPRANSVSQAILERELKSTVSKVTSAGIEVIAVGVMTESVEEFYNADTGSTSMVVYDIEKLAVNVYKVMKDQLLGRGRRGRRS